MPWRFQEATCNIWFKVGLDSDKLLPNRLTLDDQKLFVCLGNRYHDDPYFSSGGCFHKNWNDDFKGKLCLNRVAISPLDRYDSFIRISSGGFINGKREVS